MIEFVKKLVEIQSELKAPKSQNNTFGKYKYRSAEDILEAVKPLNAVQGLLLTLTDEPVLIGDWHYIKATATITDGKQSQVVTAYAREPEIKKGMDSSQITGTASSYARKYAMNGMYLIDDTKDADSDEYQNQGNQQTQQYKKAPPKQQSQSGPKLASPAQRSAIGAKVKGISEKQGTEQVAVYQGAQTALGINKPTGELTSGEASKVIEYLITQE